MKASEIRDLSLDELVHKAKELRQEIFNLKFQLATAQIENPMKIRLLKKDLAKVKTILKEKESKSEIKTQEEAAQTQ